MRINNNDERTKYTEWIKKNWYKVRGTAEYKCTNKNIGRNDDSNIHNSHNTLKLSEHLIYYAFAMFLFAKVLKPSHEYPSYFITKQRLEGIVRYNNVYKLKTQKHKNKKFN